jgi:small subunit ribosomal protein S16
VVKIRMKMMGRKHRPFFRVCAMDVRCARDGRVLEELGIYDPLVRDVDARAVLNGERIAYWLGVGAQPTEKVKTLIKKYGQNGTHLEKQKAALEKLSKAKPSARPKPLAAEAAPETEPAVAETSA